MLEAYAVRLGQRINFDKSSIIFDRCCSKTLRRCILERVGIQCQDEFGKYLGLVADFGASKKRVFESVRQKIGHRLHAWAEQFLSAAGKEILIKAVAMAMPSHAMSCFKISASLSKEIEGEISRFWWKNGVDRKLIHWVGWKQLALLKNEGGLGFRDLKCFNLAMLAKIGWRLVCQPQSLLGQVLQDKYHHGVDFLEAHLGRKERYLVGQTGSKGWVKVAGGQWRARPGRFEPMAAYPSFV